MSLQFAVYERAESTLEDLGTLATIAGRGAKLAFIPANLLSTKRVTIVVLNPKGQSATITCSSAVSNSVRSALKEGATKMSVLGALAQLRVLEREDGAHYLSLEGSGQLDFHTVAEVAKEAMSYEELVAL